MKRDFASNMTFKIADYSIHREFPSSVLAAALLLNRSIIYEVWSNWIGKKIDEVLPCLCSRLEQHDTPIITNAYSDAYILNVMFQNQHTQHFGVACKLPGKE